MKKYFYIGGSIIIFAIVLLAFINEPKISRKNLDSIQVDNSDESNIIYDLIPGSKNHSPDATWWGYNQSKIVRFENIVFMYVIHNDDDPATPSQFTIFAKDGDSPWEPGAWFPTSRPGNILIDSSGVLHVFVFEATDIIVNDSRGSLIHYWFPNSAQGNITDFEQETVIADDNSGFERVNIRVGAAISPDDTLVIAFGLTEGNDYIGHSEHLYYKKTNDNSWTHLIAGENLGHDFYYPFLLATRDGYHLLPIQDDYNGPGNQNIYQIINYFSYSNDSWSREAIVNLTAHPLATSQTRLLEQSDLYEDRQGNIHVIYKEFLDPDNKFEPLTFKHAIKKNGAWSASTINTQIRSVNWIRLFEIKNQLYYLLASREDLFVQATDADQPTKIDLAIDIKGIYPYLANPNGGTDPTGEYLDILLLAGDFSEYPSANNYYVRIPKSEIE